MTLYFSKAYAAALLAAVWAGLVLGVSFFSAPIKFRAPGVALADLLSIGKITFQAFTWIELALFVLLLVLAAGQFTKPVVALLVGLGVLLAAQKGLILPALDGQLDKVAAGVQPGGSHLHIVYIVSDLIKLALLLLMPAMVFRPDVLTT